MDIMNRRGICHVWLWIYYGKPGQSPPPSLANISQKLFFPPKMLIITPFCWLFILHFLYYCLSYFSLGPPTRGLWVESKCVCELPSVRASLNSRAMRTMDTSQGGFRYRSKLPWMCNRSTQLYHKECHPAFPSSEKIYYSYFNYITTMTLLQF